MTNIPRDNLKNDPALTETNIPRGSREGDSDLTENEVIAFEALGIKKGDFERKDGSKLSLSNQVWAHSDNPAKVEKSRDAARKKTDRVISETIPINETPEQRFKRLTETIAGRIIEGIETDDGIKDLSSALDTVFSDRGWSEDIEIWDALKGLDISIYRYELETNKYGNLDEAKIDKEQEKKIEKRIEWLKKLEETIATIVKENLKDKDDRVDDNFKMTVELSDSLKSDDTHCVLKIPSQKL
jgi:hypothetical protein